MHTVEIKISGYKNFINGECTVYLLCSKVTFDRRIANILETMIANKLNLQNLKKISIKKYSFGKIIAK